MLLCFSSCPNDTFIFHALAQKHAPQYGLEFSIKIEDIQSLNESVLRGEPDVCKVSFFTLGKVLDEYIALPIGAALGYNSGQKIVALDKKMELGHLDACSIAIPGKDTTAYFLYKLLLPQAQKEFFCLYHEVLSHVKNGSCACGIILHETRFTFKDEGLREIADLGQLWNKKYSLPLPLGCIAVKKSLGPKKIDLIIRAVSDSLKLAWRDRQLSREYIKSKSIEKRQGIIDSHINLFVNEETSLLSPTGRASVDLMFALGQEKGLLPRHSTQWLHN